MYGLVSDKVNLAAAPAAAPAAQADDQAAPAK